MDLSTLPTPSAKLFRNEGGERTSDVVSLGSGRDHGVVGVFLPGDALVLRPSQVDRLVPLVRKLVAKRESAHSGVEDSRELVASSQLSEISSQRFDSRPCTRRGG